jgi:hypothetical protein
MRAGVAMDQPINEHKHSRRACQFAFWSRLAVPAKPRSAAEAAMYRNVPAF